MASDCLALFGLVKFSEQSRIGLPQTLEYKMKICGAKI